MVGSRIRALRAARGLTVAQLAEAAEVSTGLISQVERNLADPSLETLRRVARVLDVPLFSLFTDAEPEPVAVVRRDRRVRVASPESQVVYTRVSPGRGRLEVLEGELEPGGSSSAKPWSHPGEECVVVTAGELTIEIDGTGYRLAEGDSCYFDSRMPHRYLNESAQPTRFLVSVTPPSY
ncbi:MAG: cupin domain-containing protein [Streptosporangiales bacterium]|nr:cupin domain-containing protein [Streptosporangiales bacterium]